jgi:hypothetical protein
MVSTWMEILAKIILHLLLASWRAVVSHSYLYFHFQKSNLNLNIHALNLPIGQGMYPDPVPGGQ